MESNIKYITYSSPMFDTHIIMFDFVRHHGDIADLLGLKPEEILGAGFVVFDVDSPYCCGESFSLKTESRKEDTEILLRFLKR